MNAPIENRTPDVLAAMIRPPLSQVEQLALAFYLIDQAGVDDLTRVSLALEGSVHVDMWAEAWRLFEASK